MDTKNWKSVAVRKSSYDKLLALCDKEYRNPAAFIALLVDKEIERQLERYPWAQRVNLSAKTGWHLDRLAPALRTALTNWEKRIPTAKLNAFLGELVGANPPPVRSGKQPKIKFATQAGTCPPKFVVFATGFLENAYRRFIERRLREEFGFDGTPIEVAVKLKDRDND
jgi:GTP-binding protein